MSINNSIKYRHEDDFADSFDLDGSFYTEMNKKAQTLFYWVCAKQYDVNQWSECCNDIV